PRRPVPAPVRTPRACSSACRFVQPGARPVNARGSVATLRRDSSKRRRATLTGRPRLSEPRGRSMRDQARAERFAVPRRAAVFRAVVFPAPFLAAGFAFAGRRLVVASATLAPPTL